MTRQIPPIISPAMMAVATEIRNPTSCHPPCWMAVRSASRLRVWAPLVELLQAWMTAVAMEPSNPGIRNLLMVAKENRTPSLLMVLFKAGALMDEMKAITKPTINGTQGLKLMSGYMPRAKAP